MRYVLTPCGTSLLTNAASSEGRRIISDYANEKAFNGIPADKAEYLRKLIDDVRGTLLASSHLEASRMSAEINGITRIYGGDLSPVRQDFHELLCTDTWLGKQTGAMVEEWLRKAGAHSVSNENRVDLQTGDINAFQQALSEMVKWTDEVLPGYKKSGYNIIFNLTGGFKSVQGFLQVLGMFYADEMVYIFETGNQLLRIPRLPVQMDIAESVTSNLEAFRRLSRKCVVEQGVDIPETMLLRLDDEIALSPWGEIAWRKSCDSIYEKALYPSPSAKIQYGPHFADSVKRHASGRLVEINRKIDDLMVFMEQGKNLQGLDFKQLKNGPFKDSTHEIDAWHDGKAKRIFGHYDGSVFILDQIGEALH